MLDITQTPTKEPQRKFLWIGSNLLATSAGKGKSKRKYVRMLERTLLTRFNLPPSMGI